MVFVHHYQQQQRHPPNSNNVSFSSTSGVVGTVPLGQKQQTKATSTHGTGGERKRPTNPATKWQTTFDPQQDYENLPIDASVDVEAALRGSKRTKKY